MQVLEENGTPIKMWTDGVPVEYAAQEQLRNVARLPFIHKWVAVMPDVHYGIGATVGSVIPTKGAIIPAAVGVDIGCGMIAVRTNLQAEQLPDRLPDLRGEIEKAVPVGQPTKVRGDGGSWGAVQKDAERVWTAQFETDYEAILAKHPKVETKKNPALQLGTLGGGNHFIEVCLDEADRVWIMLHSGSRGIGNRLGSYFTDLAKQDMRKWFVNLPDANLAYLAEGTDHFDDYWQALAWAQAYATTNRSLMLSGVLSAFKKVVPTLEVTEEAVNCHHNYVAIEHHYGANVYVTRKGAVRARQGDLGIIPGSMGAKTFIVRGKGNPESFDSCSHGAGRAMSRTAAKQRFTVEDHVLATSGIECRKDASVLDETPGAYKDIDAVMAAQEDLVEVVHTLRQIICVKG